MPRRVLAGATLGAGALAGSRGGTTRSARDRSPGLALGVGTLYVADTLDSRIGAIPHALTRSTRAAGADATVSVGRRLEQPPGLALDPD